jgi:hypothetical protein
MKTLSNLLAALMITGAASLVFANPLPAMPNECSTMETVAFESYDCEIKAKGTYGGVDYDITIGIDDVSGIECLKLKVALFAALF